LADIVAELDRLLEPGRFSDYCPNGLQVPGRAEVGSVATAVSGQLELFERAAAQGADLLVVHHGIFWDSQQRAIDAAAKRRLQVLFEAEMSLVAYHLPLDAHPTVGNNALLARALGAETLEPFAAHKGQTIGFIAGLGADGTPAPALFAQTAQVTGREPLVFDFGPPDVQRLAIVSGAGADYLGEAIAAGADAFLTGEPAERVMAQARESGIHFIAAGHYATETFGVRALGEHLGASFGVSHTFIDIPNPI
jgi:dinuclear metal center YbgI/SA1388 family protein